MNTVNDLYRRRQGASPSACPPDPCVCSTCGMLECLCRPRFFAGQILTADDLNRLDAYIRGKHRLHNRQLHGWGVVNGLEVTCNPCGDGVAVGCGYALSPCGDDIVVCEPVSVDVCALIKRCCTEDRWDPCEPPRHPRPSECEAGEQEWILAIRYAETPARGVQPLRPPECSGACSSGCAGGGQCSCGGCGAAQQKKPRAAPVQCEPTVVCEGFAFEVYRKPPATGRPGGDDRREVLNPQSELVQRFQCCIQLLLTEAPPLPGPLGPPTNEAASQAWYRWIVAMRAQLRRYFASHGATNCELLARFDTIPFPPSGGVANSAAIFLAAVLLVVVWMDALFACFCSALLPPCPAPSKEVRVPLASIHVSGHPCRVLRICNWSVHRKFATTFPALQYWLGMFPYGVALRKLLEQLCCFDLGVIIRGADRGVFAPQSTPHPGPHAAAAPAAPAEEEEARSAWDRANGRLNPELDEPARIGAARELLAAALARTGKTLDLGVLAEGMLLPAGRNSGTGNEGPGLGAAELANLPQFMAANGLLRPIAAGSFEPALAALAGLAGIGGAVPGGAPDPTRPDLAKMQAQLDALRASVDAQAGEIARLKAAAPASPSRSKRKPRQE